MNTSTLSTANLTEISLVVSEICPGKFKIQHIHLVRHVYSEKYGIPPNRRTQSISAKMIRGHMYPGKINNICLNLPDLPENEQTRRVWFLTVLLIALNKTNPQTRI